MKITRKLWLWILALAVLSPLGLILPEYFKAGSSLWEGGNYAFAQGKNIWHQSLSYIISAAAGIGLIALIALFLGKKIGKKE